ncbi:MAG: polysaccharide deacetylase family protein [Polyangiaceae bacterium]|nr:polysaccharide deacetylase family protein [Polyangiaceae bacterium]
MLKRGYFELLHAAGHEARLLEGLRARQRLVVLNLHEVAPVDRDFYAPLDPRDFEELLDFIEPRFRVTTVRARHEVDPSDPRPRLVLSFDDGYKSFVEYAMPILHRRGLVANQNVIGRSVETGEPPWNARLHDFLNAAPSYLINELRLPGFKLRLSGSRPDERARFGVALSRFLKLRPTVERAPLWARVEELIDRGGFSVSTRMMTIDDVKQAAQTHEIGAHSYRHESMAYEPLAFFERDLAECERVFRDVLQLPLDIYAFPNGSFRDDHLSTLRSRGVPHILIVGEKVATGRGDVVPRITLSAASAREATFQAVGLRAQGAL